MEKELDKLEKALLADLKKATVAVMKQRKVETSSDLINSVSWQEKNNVFTLVANDYFEWVDKGRKRGIMPPPQDLIPWMKKNGITPTGGMSYNQLAFVIANSIKKNGIKAKNYTTPIIDVTSDIIAEEYADVISNAIVDELVYSLENFNK